MEEIEFLLDKALPEIARRIQNELAIAAPFDTGRLRNSIKVKAEGRSLIIWMVDYGKYVEFGTPPHTINPKNKKALKFEVGKKERLERKGRKSEANIVITKEVKHPGTRPNPFIRNTFNNKFRKIVVEEIMRAKQQYLNNPEI